MAKSFFPTNEFNKLMSSPAQAALRDIQNIQTILDNIAALQKQEVVDEEAIATLNSQVTLLIQEVQTLNTNVGPLNPPWTDGQLLIGNTSENGPDKNTLTAGSGINIANSGGHITLSTAGASSLLPIWRDRRARPHNMIPPGFSGTLPANRGGTGQNAYTNGQLLIGDTTTGGLDKGTLTAGAGISITNAAGSITVAATGSTIPATALVPPQGRLTLVTGQPVMTANQAAKAHVFYTTYLGSQVPVYTGSAWSVLSLGSDLDMALDTTNQPISQVFDLFAWNNSSTLSIGAGPAWTTSATVTITLANPAVITWTSHPLAEGDPVIFTTTGALPAAITAGTVYFVGRSPGTNSFNISTTVANAAAGTFVSTNGNTQSGTQTGTNHTKVRGTGAGTTQIQMLNGIWVNQNSITLTNGAGAGTAVSANQATYLGSVYTTAAGQTNMDFGPVPAGNGTNNYLGVFNAYNQIPVVAVCRDSTSSWTYASATLRAANNSVSNRITWLDGLQQSTVEAEYSVLTFANTVAMSSVTGVGVDSTTTLNSVAAQFNFNSNTFLAAAQDTASTVLLPQSGAHFVQALESAASGSTSSFQGSRTTPTAQTQYLRLRVSM